MNNTINKLNNRYNFLHFLLVQLKGGNQDVRRHAHNVHGTISDETDFYLN